MAQTFTLEEAADKLGIPAEEFRRRLKTEWTHLRPMRDGNTLRFKDRDVEELARQIGFGSEEELQLVDPSSDEIPVPSQLKPDSAKSAKKPAGKGDAPLDLGNPEVFVLADDKPKSPSAKVNPPASKSDSDVRLEKGGKNRTASREEVAGTEEIDLGSLPKSTSSSGAKLTGSGKLSSSSSTKLSSGKSGKVSPATPQKEAESSEFELSLDPDSSDEFELSLSNDSGEEISLGDMPKAPSKKGGQSGINIGRPADSGLSLEKKSDSSKGKKSGKNLVPGKTESDDEIDFELSLDQPGASSKKLGFSSSKKIESDSEFELTLDDASSGGEAETSAFHAVDEQKNDIFETDFEIPALDDDSASEAVALDEADTDLESSDFDLAADGVDDESASQVVVLDDETEPRGKSKKKAAVKSKKKAALLDDDVVVDNDAVSFDEMELDEGQSASKALKGAARDAYEDDEREVVVVAGSAPWGPFPALAMLPTIFVIFLGGIMAYELMHSIWGYHQPEKPNSMVIDKVAEAFDLKPKENAK